MNIIHQKQPTPLSCVSTCIAMLLGVPAEKVIEEFHDDYRSGKAEIDKYLKMYGINAQPVLSNSVIEWDKLYLIVVPSLNKLAHAHEIIVDTRGDDPKIFDPNMGKPEKLYYVNGSEPNKTKLEVGLVDYFVDYEIILNE